jgi:hypothetical protein
VFEIGSMEAIDKMMNNTIYLDAHSILDFLAAMIEISNQEINFVSPRVYSL